MNIQSEQKADLQLAFDHYQSDEELVLQTIAKYDAFDNRTELYNSLRNMGKRNKTDIKKAEAKSQLKKLLEWRQQGVLEYSYLEMAAKLGLGGPNTISNYAQEMGFNFNPVAAHKNKYRSDKTIPFRNVMTDDHYYSFWSPSVAEVVVKFMPYCDFDNIDQFHTIRNNKGFPSREEKWENEKRPQIKRKLDKKANGELDLTYEDIGIILNVSVGAITTVVEKEGYDFRDNAGPEHVAEKHNVQYDEFAEDYYEGDMTYEELAEKHTGRPEAWIAKNIIDYFDLPSRQKVKHGDVDVDNVTWHNESQFNDEDLRDIMGELGIKDNETVEK